MNKPRLNRFLASDGKCFDVAIDHGFFNEPRFLGGIEDMERAVQAVVRAAPDAIQLTVGQAGLLQRLPGKEKPALVLRTDVANVYGQELPRTMFSVVLDDIVEQAVRLDAACLCINLFLLPGEPEVYEQCIRNISRVKPVADRYGMPLMIEPLVMKSGAQGGGYAVDGDLDKIKALVRQAVELGADVIKADPTYQVNDYHQVIEVAGEVPVLVRGGGRVSDAEVLERTFELMRQGASGIVYGRNVIHHPHPTAMTRALMAIVHQNATPAEALALLKGGA